MSYRRCLHFVNTYTLCRAGVDVATLADAAGRYPCVSANGRTGERTCARLDTGVREVDRGEMARRLELFMGGRCPTCNQEMRGELESNGAVLATPCRHVIRARPKDDRSSTRDDGGGERWGTHNYGDDE